MKIFSLLYQGDIHTVGDEKIIKAEHFSHLKGAAEVLQLAKEDAEKMKESTLTECERLKQEARDTGFSEGLSQFNEHLVQFEQRLKEIHHQMQQNLLPIALQAAKKIVGKQIELEPSTILDIVRQALGPVSQNHKFILWVSKQDKEILDAHKPEIKAMLEQLQSLHIKEREDVTVGGCIIETESGIINATLENQWRSLEAAFTKFMKK